MHNDRMEDELLDISDDDILVEETQINNSLNSFSRDLIERLGIRNTNKGTEAATLNEQT